MSRYHVFLSHASADKPAVEHLARKLREEGLEPFLDRAGMILEDWESVRRGNRGDTATGAQYPEKQARTLGNRFTQRLKKSFPSACGSLAGRTDLFAGQLLCWTVARVT